MAVPSASIMLPSVAPVEEEAAAALVVVVGATTLEVVTVVVEEGIVRVIFAYL